jgi:uncharacterized protein YciI
MKSFGQETIKVIFALLCQDKPGHLHTRLDTRSSHLKWLDGLNKQGKVRLAGPFLGEDGKPTGSLILIEADDMDAAREIASADPYVSAGLFSNVEIKAFSWVVNNPDAGE